MIDKTENEVYFLGKKKKTQKRKYAIVIACLSLLLVSVVCVYIYHTKPHAKDSKELSEIEIVPKNMTSPKFDRKYDFNAFFKWFSDNIEYPKGYETIDAKVVVTFVITKDGIIDSIRIDSQPKQDVFAKQVVNLLKKCPKWTPGKLADGTPVNMSYTLPVQFRPPERSE